MNLLVRLFHAAVITALLLSACGLVALGGTIIRLLLPLPGLLGLAVICGLLAWNCTDSPTDH